MARNIKTATVELGTEAYTDLSVAPHNVFTVYAHERDLYLCFGASSVEDDNAFFIPEGVGVELDPPPIAPIFMKASVAGKVSFWYG